MLIFFLYLLFLLPSLILPKNFTTNQNPNNWRDDWPMRGLSESENKLCYCDKPDTPVQKQKSNNIYCQLFRYWKFHNFFIIWRIIFSSFLVFWRGLSGGKIFTKVLKNDLVLGQKYFNFTLLFVRFLGGRGQNEGFTKS